MAAVYWDSRSLDSYAKNITKRILDIYILARTHFSFMLVLTAMVKIYPNKPSRYLIYI